MKLLTLLAPHCERSLCIISRSIVDHDNLIDPWKKMCQKSAQVPLLVAADRHHA